MKTAHCWWIKSKSLFSVHFQEYEFFLDHRHYLHRLLRVQKSSRKLCVYEYVYTNTHLSMPCYIYVHVGYTQIWVFFPSIYFICYFQGDSVAEGIFQLQLSPPFFFVIAFPLFYPSTVCGGRCSLKTLAVGSCCLKRFLSPCSGILIHSVSSF